MTAQMHFFNVFSEKDPHLNAVEMNFVTHFLIMMLLFLFGFRIEIPFLGNM